MFETSSTLYQWIPNKENKDLERGMGESSIAFASREYAGGLCFTDKLTDMLV
jgi:hypothetical protein